MTGTQRKLSPDAIRALVAAMIIEAACIFVGIAIFFSTDRIIWVLIGAIAGTGFSAPAIIKFIRASKGQKDA